MTSQRIGATFGSSQKCRTQIEETIFYKALRCSFLYNLEEIDGAYEVKEFKRTVMIKRLYQCNIAANQLPNLQMLEFCNDFLDKYFSRQDFELCYMDNDLFYVAMSDGCLDETVKSEKRQAY